MPKHFLLRAAAAFFCLLAAPRGKLFAQNAQLTVASGTTLTLSGNHLVLNNTNLDCEGSVNAGPGNVWVTGSNNSTFSGSGVPVIGTLQMASAATATLTLLSNLDISSLVNFQQGVIDLNGEQLLLTNSAFLQGESETSHLTALTGGSVQASATGVANPNQLNIGQLGAMLTSSATLGTLTVTRMGKPASNPNSSGYQGINRVYLIQPQNDAGLNATLRFYYLNEELNGKDASTLNLYKSADGITWTLSGADTRNATEKYVEKTGISDLSFWTMSDLVNPLPLTLVSFSATCEGGYALVRWQTGLEGNLDRFVIQGSGDGSQWASIGEVAATDNPQGSTYSFQDTHPGGYSFYRLMILYRSGETDYSPVFGGSCSDMPLPFELYPNPAETQTVARLSVRQATPAVLQVIDMKGNILYRMEWNLQAGVNSFSLPTGVLAAGNYIVRLILPNTVLQTKLVKK
jgi:hypothetical protein